MYPEGMESEVKLNLLKIHKVRDEEIRYRRNLKSKWLPFQYINVIYLIDTETVS